MTKKKFILIGLLISIKAFSQTDSLSASLEEIVVTANRFPQKQINTGKILTVITREQIEKSPNINLGELLNRQSGLTVIGASNAPGTNPDIYLRGSATGNALILIDGNPATDASTIRSTFDLNFIPLGEIERIEILKGGQSTIYGSDAVAGVINIITKKAAENKTKTTLHLSRGSYQTNQLDLGIYGKLNKIQYKAQMHQLNSKGFSSAADTAVIKSFDNDGMNQRVFRAEIGSTKSSKWEWSTSAQLSKYENDLDQTAYEDAKDSKVANNNLQVNASVTKKINIGSIHANTGLNNNERNYLDGDYSSTLSSDSTKITISSFFTSIVYNSKKKLNMEAGLRVNNHSRLGTNMTYTINPSYVWENLLKFSLNISSAFKAPTLYQLYDGYAGQRNLKPETSITTEFAAQLVGLKNINARMVYFNRQIKNGIDYNYSTYKYFNYASQKNHGVELEAGYLGSRSNLNLNYTYNMGTARTTAYSYDPGTYSYIEKGDTSYSNLFRVPIHSINIFGGFQFNKKIFVSIVQRITGKRYEPQFQAPSVLLKPYQTTDLMFQYKIGKKIAIYFSLKNLLNNKYQEVLGFNTRGRNYVVGIRL